MITIPAGTYAVGATLVAGGASAAFNDRDATCNKSGPDSVGGSVTLTSELGVLGSPASGSYSIQFEDGTSQAGQFAADYCDTSTISGTSTCVP
ncbi:MAG TPA: hypothetical protein VGI10_01590 [Polyangiaceae bacterium]